MERKKIDELCAQSGGEGRQTIHLEFSLPPVRCCGAGVRLGSPSLPTLSLRSAVAGEMWNTFPAFVLMS